jgi:hypothetical protein
MYVVNVSYFNVVPRFLLYVHTYVLRRKKADTLSGDSGSYENFSQILKSF